MLAFDITSHVYSKSFTDFTEGAPDSYCGAIVCPTGVLCFVGSFVSAIIHPHIKSLVKPLDCIYQPAFGENTFNSVFCKKANIV